MTWNSPFQPLQPTAPINRDAQSYDDLNFTDSIIDFSALNTDGALNNYAANNFINQQPTQINQFNTDIPALDDLFSELNSDLNSTTTTTAVGAADFGAKSEPVNFEDIERILLPQITTRKSKQPNCKMLSFSSFHLNSQTAF